MACVLLSLYAPAATAATATEGGGPDWTVTPASGGGRPSLYLEGPPGTVLEDALSLTNRGDRPLTLRLGADADAGAGTGAGAGSGADAGRDSGTGAAWAGWVRFATDRVTVPPRTRADVPFTVTVPTTTPPGDHTGTLTATTAPPRAREATVPLRLRVTGPRLPALTVENLRIDSDAIHYTLVNRGNTPLDAHVTLHAKGTRGTTLLHRPEHSTGRALPPAARRPVITPWPSDDRPGLDRVTVHVTATAAGTRRARAEATYTPPGAVAAVWTTGTLATAAVAAAAGTALRRRRQDREAPR